MSLDPTLTLALGYELQISQVGPDEYPLIAVLRDTVFGEFNHVSGIPLEEMLAGRRDVLALIAHLEGNPVGFKIGYRHNPRVYYSLAGGMLKDYRGQGMGRRMQQWQQEFARSRGYQKIFFNTFNHFRGMMLLGLRDGYLPTAVDVRPEGDLAVQFWKDVRENPKPPPDLPGIDASRLLSAHGVDFAGRRVLRIDRTDAPRLIQSLHAGFDVAGLVDDGAADKRHRRFFILLSPPREKSVG